jgi:tetratricopeptide (TPR) repeat protein
MDDNLPIIYLSGVVILLALVAIFVLREIVKSRRTEGRFSRLQQKLREEKGTAKEYYELGSIYLDKKLFSQAVKLLQKATKIGGNVEPENRALIYNALGYAHFAEEQYDLAIRNYKEALKLYPEYAIALNNLGNVYEKKQMTAKALETYEETLKIDPNNSVAKRRATSLRKRLVSN